MKPSPGGSRKVPGPPDGRCLSCGRPLGEDHSRCAFDPPRLCARCGRRLRVQVLPQGYLVSCPSCDKDADQ